MLATLDHVTDSEYLVIDNFLSEAERLALWDEICRLPFAKVHEGRWKKAFHVRDGEAWWGPNYFHHAHGEPQAEYATIKALADRIEGSPQVLSFLASCGDWTQLSLQPYLYPAGSGLSWHLDGGNRAAAFIYYAHPHWHPAWGGELMIANGPSARDAAQIPADIRSFDRFYGKFDVTGLLDGEGGKFVFPSPNRLVLLRGGTPHSIKKVEEEAGEAFRASIAGFFSAPEAAAAKS
jgi:hypothetical protein